MRISGNIGIRLVLTALFALAPSATYAEEEDVTEFEGWEDTGKKKEKEEKETSTPTGSEVAPAPVPAPRVEERAPESHKGLLPSVYHRYGSLAITGIFQTLFDTTFVLDDNEDTEGVAFSFQRARIMLDGHLINENFRYFFQGDAGNPAGFILDMYVSCKFPGPGLTLRFGRFIPDFSLMLPRNKADIDAINLPIYLVAPRPGSFAPWRQIGLEASLKASEQLTFKLGVFNGFWNDPYTLDPLLAYNSLLFIPGTPGNWTDNNKSKDVMLQVAFQPNRELLLALHFWFGFPEGIEYNTGKLHLLAEFMFRVLSYGDDAADPGSRTGLSFWAHAGYRLNDLVEGVFRVEWLEPDTENDQDMLMRFTLGPHFWIEDKHFRILVNLFFDIPLDSDAYEEVVGLLAQAAVMW
jgi:hypothetical protein